MRRSPEAEEDRGDGESVGFVEAVEKGDGASVGLILIDTFKPAFSFPFILMFIAASFLQENHPYLFGAWVVAYIVSQGFNGRRDFTWSNWSFPYRATGKAVVVILGYILIGALWAVFRSVLNIIRLDRLAASEVVDFYAECHKTAAAKMLNASETGPVLCTQAEYIHMMALQKVGFLKSMLIWPFDMMRIFCTELIKLGYDYGFALYQRHGGKLLRWGDAFAQKYLPEEL